MIKEEKLILSLIRPSFDDSSSCEVSELLKDGIDWDLFFEKSGRESVLPLIYHRLNKIDPKKNIPKNISEKLKACYYETLLRNIIFSEKAGRILNAFQNEGIKAILLKGFSLAENIYNNIALRPFSDADILIDKNDIAKANMVLNDLGFLSPPNYEDNFMETRMDSIASFVYRHPQDKIFIHLHWHIINTTWPIDSIISKIDMGRIWAMSEKTEINGTSFSSLSLNHLIIYLSCHCFSHCADRFILLSDIAWLLDKNREKINWKELADEAERFNLSYIVTNCLSLVSSLFDLKIEAIKKSRNDKMTILQKYLSSSIKTGKRKYLFYYLAYFSLQKGFSAKLRFIFKTIFPSAKVMAHNLNISSSAITPAYYWRRIFHGFSRTAFL